MASLEPHFTLRNRSNGYVVRNARLHSVEMPSACLLDCSQGLRGIHYGESLLRLLRMCAM